MSTNSCLSGGRRWQTVRIPVLLVVLLVAIPAATARIGAQEPDPAAQAWDPVGDTFGTSPLHDVTTFSVASDGSDLTLTMVFNGPVGTPGSGGNAVGGYIDLDTDQNPNTGASSHVTIYPQCASSNLGMDYYVNLSFYNT